MFGRFKILSLIHAFRWVSVFKPFFFCITIDGNLLDHFGQSYSLLEVGTFVRRCSWTSKCWNANNRCSMKLHAAYLLDLTLYIFIYSRHQEWHWVWGEIGPYKNAQICKTQSHLLYQWHPWWRYSIVFTNFLILMATFEQL